MNTYRIIGIYNTMSRAVCNTGQSAKRQLFDRLHAIGEEFNGNAVALTAGQIAFDTWHENKLTTLMELPFSWADRSHGEHGHLTLGLAQKFLNLMLKDWWGTGACKNMDYSVLHAPFDGQVWNVLWRLYPRFDCPSLKRGSTYKGISYWNDLSEYRSYQAHLISPAINQAISRQMQGRMRRLGLSQPPVSRIEVEQLVWSS